MKMVEEANMTIIEMEGTILKASTNNRMINVTNILGISEDLWNLIQCDMENQMYQIQRMLANKLDAYKEKDNKYMENNIKEIQELYQDKEYRKNFRNQGGIKEDKVILIKPYKVSTLLSATTTKSSFINNEVENLLKYIKFV